MAAAYIYRTNTSTASSWTFSAWVKRAGLGNNYLLSWGSSIGIGFGSTDYLQYYDSGSGSNPVTTAKYRDPSAWYHIVVKNDAGTLTFYVNGETPAGSGGTTGHALSSSTMSVGSFTSGSNSLDGCMSHVHFVDGTAYSASTFGETDATSGIWKIKTSPTVTYGSQGFFLKMEDRTNLDLDSSPNALTFTTSGDLTATYDNPSNNFCTLNPLAVATSNPITFGNGNNTGFFTSTAAWRATFGTLAPSSGKWYYEAIGGNSSGHLHVAIASLEWANALGVNNELGTTTLQPSYSLYGTNGNMYYSTTSAAATNTAYGSAYVETDYIGCYFDLDNNKIYFAKNGVLQNLTGSDAIGFSIQSGYTYSPALGLYNQTAAGTQCNFGNGSFGSTSLTGTTYSDVGGEGTFKYNPSTGTFDGASKDFRAICTKNIKAYG